jgi:hypothetical protein
MPTKTKVFKNLLKPYQAIDSDDTKMTGQTVKLTETARHNLDTLAENFDGNKSLAVRKALAIALNHLDEL